MDRGSAGPWPLGCVWGVPGKKVMDRIGVQQQAGTFTQLCMGLKGELIVWFRGGFQSTKTYSRCMCVYSAASVGFLDNILTSKEVP